LKEIEESKYQLVMKKKKTHSCSNKEL